VHRREADHRAVHNQALRPGAHQAGRIRAADRRREERLAAHNRRQAGGPRAGRSRRQADHSHPREVPQVDRSHRREVPRAGRSHPREVVRNREGHRVDLQAAHSREVRPASPAGAPSRRQEADLRADRSRHRRAVVPNRRHPDHPGREEGRHRVDSHHPHQTCSRSLPTCGSISFGFSADARLPRLCDPPQTSLAHGAERSEEVNAPKT
jgi:hypothetical protein